MIRDCLGRLETIATLSKVLPPLSQPIFIPDKTSSKRRLDYAITRHDKTGEEKTRQGTGRNDNTTKNKTPQDNTRQHTTSRKTRQYTTRPVKTR